MKIKHIFIFMIFSTIIKFISSKEEKFLSKFEQKKQSDIPISFLEKNSPKDIDDSNEEINLERFLNKFHFILPGCLRNRIEDYEVEDESDGKKIKFNPFKNTESSPFSTVVKIDGNKTIKLAGKKNIKNTYINKVDSFHGVLIRLNEEGDFCNKEGKRHQTTFLCGCDHEVENKNILDTFKYRNNGDSCNHHIEMRFLFGCKLKSGVQLYKFIKKYKSTTAVPLIILGLIICFFGAKWFNITVYFICGVASCYVIIPLILIVKDELLSTDQRIFACIIGTFVLGAILGAYFKNKAKFPIILLSGLAGYSANSFVFSIVNKFFTNDYLYYICLIGCIVGGIFLGFTLVKYAAIAGTAAFGGYLAVQEAVPIYFPKAEDHCKIGWIVMSAVGCIFQWKSRDKIGAIFDK